LSFKRKLERVGKIVEDPYPKNVALVGLGPSWVDFGSTAMRSCYFDCDFHWDEVWTLNAGIRMFQHDKLFAMDDLRVGAKRYPEYGRLLKEHDKPIFTSVAYPEFPTSVTFPIKEVGAKMGPFAAFDNTAVYAIAYACWSGVRNLYLYGCDFHYVDPSLRERGGQAATYMIGICKGMGMNINLPPTTTLLAANEITMIDNKPYRPFYGYLKHPLIEDEELALDIQKDQECRQEEPTRGPKVKVENIRPENWYQEEKAL